MVIKEFAMKEVRGQFWDVVDEVDAICCTTNRIVDGGELVMGGGIAYEFAERYPWLPAEWGRRLTENPSVNLMVTPDDTGLYLVALPTKEHYRNPSPVELVIKSCKELKEVADIMGWQYVLTVPPGCGLGGLKWDEVKPQLSFLDDRFTVINNR